jgi:hypothetical protein
VAEWRSALLKMPSRSTTSENNGQWWEKNKIVKKGKSGPPMSFESIWRYA